MKKDLTIWWAIYKTQKKPLFEMNQKAVFTNNQPKKSINLT